MIMKWIKKTINEFKYKREVKNAQLEESNLPDIDHSMINRDGIVVIRNDEEVRRHNEVFACAMQCTLAGYEEPIPVIIVDGYFNKLSKNARRFVIEHELAHFKTHRFESFNPDVSGAHGDFIRKDREADIKAFKAMDMSINKVVKALREMKKIMNTHVHDAYYTMREECIRDHAKYYGKRVMTKEELKWAKKIKSYVVEVVDPEDVVVY